jgi:hypothetical protein
MANPVSLATMITAVQVRAGIVNFTGLVTLPMIRDLLNEEIVEMMDEQVTQRGMEYFRSSVTFQTVPNQSGYPLPTDFFELMSMDVVVSPFQTLTARPYSEWERNRFRWMNGWVSWLPVWYRLLGTASISGAALTPGTVNFTPTPIMQSIFTLNYVPCFQPFDLTGLQDGNVIDGVNGWHFMAVWGATASVLEIMEQDSTYALQKKEAVRQRIAALGADRNAYEPEQIHDVTARDDDAFGFGFGNG